MNIALFTDSYLPTKSGIVTVVVQLRKILTELGHHVVIVTVSPHGYESAENEDPDVLRIFSIPAPVGDNQYIAFPHKKVVVNFLKEHNISLEDFIFNDRYMVVIDGDEYRVFHDMFDAGLINKPEIEVIKGVYGDEYKDPQLSV